MILIDLTKPTQLLVLTLTEKTTIDAAVYTLTFFNDATKEDYSISLDDKLLNTNSRYDLFELANSLFDGMSIGYYTYTIFQDEAKASIIERGKLLIKKNEQNEQAVEIISPIRKDEYIIYK